MPRHPRPRSCACPCPASFSPWMYPGVPRVTLSVCVPPGDWCVEPLEWRSGVKRPVARRDASADSHGTNCVPRGAHCRGHGRLYRSQGRREALGCLLRRLWLLPPLHRRHSSLPTLLRNQDSQIDAPKLPFQKVADKAGRLLHWVPLGREGKPCGIRGVVKGVGPGARRERGRRIGGDLVILLEEGEAREFGEDGGRGGRVPTAVDAGGGRPHCQAGQGARAAQVGHRRRTAER